MARFKANKTKTREQILQTAIVEGKLYVAKDTGELFLDITGSQRIQLIGQQNTNTLTYFWLNSELPT